MLIVFSKCFSVGRVDETLFVFLQASIGGAIRKLKFGNQSYTQKESFRYEAGSRGSWLSGYCWSNWSVRAATKQIMLHNVQVWFWLRSIVTTHKDVLPEKETFGIYIYILYDTARLARLSIPGIASFSQVPRCGGCKNTMSRDYASFEEQKRLTLCRCSAMEPKCGWKPCSFV